MGKGADAKMEVNEYLLSIHYGLCSGPIDALLEIQVDEKVAWSGWLDQQFHFNINQPNLFGGKKKEGGVRGNADFLPGEASQVIPDYLAARMGLTSATCPAYRGVATFFFTGDGPFPGFYWKANVPYLPGAWFKVRRRPRGLNDATSMIGPDANPAHIIFECIINTDWGMGSSAALVDVDSFLQAAQTLFNENFGLSWLWTRQTSIETFINEMIDHIQAVFFVNPRTGLMTLKLIRDDYNPDDLPALNPDNCTVTKFQRKLWGETTNEIVVTWTNPANEQEETVIQQDLANIVQQGAVVSDSRNYYAIRNANLASQVAARDLRAAASPLASFEIDVDRSGWDLLPGGLFKLTYPEHGIYDLILRIGPVNYGKPGAATVKVTATEDVFTQQTQAYVLPPSTEWSDPSENPVPMAFVRGFTLPAYLSMTLAGRGLDSGVYPEVLVGLLAAQPGQDTYAYDLMDATLGTVLGTRDIVGRAILQSPMAAEARTRLLSFPPVTGAVVPTVSQIVFIGDDADARMEIGRISAQDDSGWLLERGLFDTTPRLWPAGTRIWFMDPDAFVYDTRAQSVGAAVSYKLLPLTSKGALSADAAPVVSVVPDDRPYRPLRPANVTVGGANYGTLSGAGFGPWAVTWANRNRRTEDSVVLGWDAGTVTPEAGQTTTITLLTMAGAVIRTIDDLTVTTYSLTRAQMGGNNNVRVRVTSKRDDLESLQGHEIVMSGIN